MRALILDREDRCARIVNVKRSGRVIVYGDKEYAMRGVSWAWGRPAYPRSLFALQFVPIIGPILSRRFFLDTFVILAEGVPVSLEPQSNTLEQSMTDEQALAIMEAHAEASSLSR